MVEADMSDLASLKEAVKGASVIFAVTDFIAAGSIETETQQGLNIQEAALATFDTLELFIWSTVPDPRAQKIPYQNVIHANSKIEIGKSLQASKLGGILTEVRVGAYYQNMVKAPQLYGVQKVRPLTTTKQGSNCLNDCLSRFPMDHGDCSFLFMPTPGCHLLPFKT